MVSDKKYRFGTTVFRIESPLALKEDSRFEAFLVEDTVKEDYTFRIYPVETCCERSQKTSVKVKREGNIFIVSIRKSLIPEITIANLFSAADTAKLLPERNEFVLHASYVVYKGKAILFCAPSGTGKSTQAGFWHSARDTITVNEDRVIIFRQNGEYFAGGCWATGQAKVCHNISAPIHRIVLLEQGAENRILNLSLAEKFQRIIAQCSFDSERVKIRDRMISDVLSLIAAVPVIGYECVNDISSVEELEKHL